MLESSLISTSVVGAGYYFNHFSEDWKVKQEKEKERKEAARKAKEEAKKAKTGKTEEEKRESREKYRSSVNSLLTTSATSSVTTVLENTISGAHKATMYDKYSQSYIESMSDEELVAALEKMNLLESEQEFTEKTI